MPKPAIRLSAIDLNLLVVFDAVMQERSVTRAAKKLALSQPALSHALGRLRHMLKDELFVPSPKGMLPTPRAEELYAPLKESLKGLQQALEPMSFDPANSRGHFRIAEDIYSSIVLTRPIAEQILAAAPKVLLDFKPNLSLDAAEVLESQGFDLAVGPFPPLGARFQRQVLLKDEFVAVLHEDQDCARTAKLSLEQFASLPHIEITSVPYTTGFIDEALAAHRLKRRVVLRAPVLSAMLLLLEHDYICVGRRRAVEVLVPHHPMVIRPLPFASAPMETALVWAKRLDNHPGHRWLREQFQKIAGKLNSTKARLTP